MSVDEAAHRARELREMIRQHNYLYYVRNEPRISDEEFDLLFSELVALESAHPELRTDDSPTHTIGAKPLEQFPKVLHAAPMQSLEASRERDALLAFDARVRSVQREPIYVLEPKLDGASIEIVYENGLMVRGATRGDGRVGEGIRDNLRTIRSVPLRLRNVDRKPPRFLSVRGEVLMSIEGFDQLNARMESEGLSPFANPRNAAAGSLRQLDPAITAQRRLRAYFYDILAIEGVDLRTQREVRVALADWGLRLPEPSGLAASVEEIFEFHQRMEESRDGLAIEIDGIVIKLDDLEARRTLGSTARHPRWAYALKFAPRRSITRILNVISSVGRTGVVTPVAIMHPVVIGGVRVTRASLHNREEVARKDLRIGDRVRVQRAGDVIPEIVERIPEPEKPRQPPFAMPKRCPSCAHPLVQEGPRTLCTNRLACPAQATGRLVHFASREALNIRGLGLKTASALVNSGAVRNLPDLYDLRVEDIAALPGFARASASKLINEIAKSTPVTLDRFVYALGIPDVGLQVARDLSEHFHSFAALRSADEEQLAAIRGVGERMAARIVAFFRAPENRAVIDRLLRSRISIRETPRRTNQRLAGKTFVFTGTLEGLPRAEASDLVAEQGGKSASALSAATDYLVAGEQPGSKLARARELGVTVLDEAAFRSMLRTP